MFSTLLLLTGTLVVQALFLTDFEWVYPLDDAYIHLSIAKNIALNGAWGLTPGEFQFSSSSPLFTAGIAAGMWVLGNHLWIPLFFNTGICFGFWIWLRRRFSAWSIGWCSLLFLAGPVPLLVLLGMEHVLHCWLASMLIWYAVEAMVENRTLTWRLMLLAILASSVRYESLFLVGSLCAGLMLKQRFVEAGKLLLAGIVPILVIGIISSLLDGTFLPLPIWLKGHAPGVSVIEWARWVLQAIRRLYENPFLLLLLLGLLWLACKTISQSGKASILLAYFSLILVSSLLLHLFFAEVGGYRYEAYLVIAGLFCLAKGIEHIDWLGWKQMRIPQRWIAGTGISLFLLPFIIRAGFFYVNYPLSTQNIYHQQIMMSNFVKRYDPTASLAANDIGAISYFSDIQLTDLLGIGDQTVARHRKSNTYTMEVVDSLAKERNIRLAVLHEEWVGKYLPESWVLIASWTISENFICAFDRISWYAVQPEERMLLRQHLQEFESQLPASVLVEYHE